MNCREKSMLKINRIIQFLFLMSSLLLSSNFVTAQSTTDKEDENNNQGSLQGLTEAILVNGQPVLKILSRKNGSTEVKLQKRDGEDSLVFNIHKIFNSFGKLYVTKTKVIYVPDDGNKQYFNIEKTKIKRVELKNRWKLRKINNVNIEFDNDEKPVLVAFDNSNEFSNGDKQSSLAANSFLFRSIKDFDSALTEFNQLTASVRLKDEDEEEIEEEETETDVNDKYDRFKDVTVISTTKMLVRGNKRSIRTYAEYSFAGKTQKKPEKVSLYFYASAARPLFREDNLELNFLVDDKRISLGEMKLADEEKTKTTTKQTVVFTMPYETFEQIANGKKVEFQIGTLEYKLTDIHLEAFRKLLTYKIEE